MAVTKILLADVKLHITTLNDYTDDSITPFLDACNTYVRSRVEDDCPQEIFRIAVGQMVEWLLQNVLPDTSLGSFSSGAHPNVLADGWVRSGAGTIASIWTRRETIVV